MICVYMVCKRASSSIYELGLGKTAASSEASAPAAGLDGGLLSYGSVSINCLVVLRRRYQGVQ